jgi:hypothetical protein
MNWAAISKKLFKLAGKLVAATFVYSLLRNAGFYGFTAPEAEGLGTMLLLVGSIYAVIYAFAIFVIWGQFNDVENLVMRECHSLNDLLSALAVISIRIRIMRSGAPLRNTRAGPRVPSGRRWAIGSEIRKRRSPLPDW